MSKLFLNITPSYPLRQLEYYRVQVAESESGKEVRSTRWIFPKRDWDLVWHIANRTTEKEQILNVLRRTKGGGISFFWKEPNETSNFDIYIGTGTGSRENWVLPVWGAEGFTIYVNSVVMTVGSQYTVASCSGINSHHILQINSPPPSEGHAVHCSYTNGYYTPLVRQVSQFESTLIPPGMDKFEIRLTFRETKEEMPLS